MNKLSNGPSVESTNGPTGGIYAHKEHTPSPAKQSTNKSYPESEPCAPAAQGSPLSYKGGKKAGSDGNQY